MEVRCEECAEFWPFILFFHKHAKIISILKNVQSLLKKKVFLGIRRHDGTDSWDNNSENVFLGRMQQRGNKFFLRE